MQRPRVSGGERRRRECSLLAPQPPELCLQLRYMRLGSLRASLGCQTTFLLPRVISNRNGLGRRWAEKLAQFDVQVPHATVGRSGQGGVRKKVTDSPPK